MKNMFSHTLDTREYIIKANCDNVDLYITFYHKETEKIYEKLINSSYLDGNSLDSISPIVEHNLLNKSIVYVQKIDTVKIRFGSIYNDIVTCKLWITLHIKDSKNLPVSLIEPCKETNNDLKERIDKLEGVIESLKENTLYMIGTYDNSPIFFKNPYESCELTIKTGYKSGHCTIVPYIELSSECCFIKVIYVNYYFLGFESSFKHINCSKLTINFNAYYDYGLYEKLPLSLESIDFLDMYSFKKFLSKYDKSCKKLYKIELYGFSIDGSDKSYNLSLLSEYGIKELYVIGGDIKNVDPIENVEIHHKPY